MTFTATPVQVKLMDTITDGVSRIIGFGGGIRGTKTWGSLAALITLCRVFPNSRWAVIRKDLQRLRETTLPSFEKLRPLAGDFVGPVNQQRWEADCANGSCILFRGENIDKDPELLRFHGYEVNGFLNEEADELSERTLTKEKERAGTWIVPNDGEQPPAYILNTFNPTARWPKKVFYVPWRDGTIKAPYAFIPTTAADNPYISDDQRESWTEMPESEYRRFVLGDWESISGAYYDTLSPAHIIQRSALPSPLPEHWRYWGSFDWGYGHWAVMGFWCTDEQGIDYLIRSVWLRKLQDTELAEAYIQEATNPDDIDAPRLKRCLALVYAGHDCWSQHKAHGASAISTKDVFSQYGILLTKADIDLVNGGRAVNRQLKLQFDVAGKPRCNAYMVEGEGNARVYEQLGEIMPDEDDIRKPEKVDADGDGKGGDDGADMFRYGIATRIRNAVAPTHSKDVKQPNRATILTVKDGKAVKTEKQPKTLEEMVAWAAKRQQGGGRLPSKTRLPPKR